MVKGREVARLYQFGIRVLVQSLKLGLWEPNLWASMLRMIEEVVIKVEGRRRESQPLHQGSKKKHGSSKVHSNDLTTLFVKVSALKEVMPEMANRVEKVENDFGTFETHTLN